jgi:hypothetical protein
MYIGFIAYSFLKKESMIISLSALRAINVVIPAPSVYLTSIRILTPTPPPINAEVW